MAVIELTGVLKDYTTEAETLHVLKGINLQIEAGEFVAIMGPSGSGKSTLMNILGCLDVPTDGVYRLAGSSVGELDDSALAGLRNRTLGFVFQGFNLMARSSLEDNVALPLVYAGVSRSDRNLRAREMLAKVGLEGYARSLPNRISGGQQQRVAIARALVGQPAVVLADEPTGNLDSTTSAEIMRLFERLNHEEGVTLIVVTHEQDIAAWAKRLVVLKDGLIQYDGPIPPEFRRHE
jgi:putative ABC transport system ATP-binding protein